MYTHAKSMLIKQNQMANFQQTGPILLTPIVQCLQVRVASLPYFSCPLLSPGRPYFLNKNLLVTVYPVDEGHSVTYDLLMPVFLCETIVPHDEFAQPVIFLC